MQGRCKSAESRSNILYGRPLEIVLVDTGYWKGDKEKRIQAEGKAIKVKGDWIMGRDKGILEKKSDKGEGIRDNGKAAVRG